jgi:hypothetical protein
MTMDHHMVDSIQENNDHQRQQFEHLQEAILRGKGGKGGKGGKRGKGKEGKGVEKYGNGIGRKKGKRFKKTEESMR